MGSLVVKVICRVSVWVDFGKQPDNGGAYPMAGIFGQKRNGKSDGFQGVQISDPMSGNILDRSYQVLGAAWTKVG